MIDRRDIEDFYPLSPMQQGMLFHSLYSPDSGMYVEQEIYSLRGDLDVAALERAWRHVVQRHSILRTAFVGEGLKEPIQRVHRNVNVCIELQDWREIPEAEQKSRLANVSEADRRKGFKLSDPPLFRLVLMRTETDAYELVWTYHHILLDGWSVAVLLQEILALYEAYRKGEEIELPLPRPYRDYVVWLRQQDPAEAEEFWRRTLQGVTSPTPLPNIHLERANDGDEGEYDSVLDSLDASVTAAIIEMSRRHQLTISTVIHGIWALLLRRYSGCDDVVFGTTVSGRPPDLQDAESMVGLFINTLPVRARIRGNDTVAGWLRLLQDQLAELRQYEYSPLIDVQRLSGVPRGTPLFESIVVFENYPTPKATDATAGEIQTLEVRNARTVEQANFPLALVAGATDDRLPLQVHFSRSRFDSAAVRNLLGHLRVMFESFAADSEQLVSSVPLLSSGERARVLTEWSGTTATYPHDKCLHELFEERVEVAPKSQAIVFEGEEITYGELNRRANQLAHYLMKQGIMSETMVGLCLERSPEMLVSILGVLKAGGAYVPLDPGLPAQRLDFMLRDTDVPAVLTVEELASKFSDSRATVISLDGIGDALGAESSENPGATVTPDNLAYVIYTSGSTGKPKGTLLQHRGVCNFLTDYSRLGDIDSSSRVLQFFNFGFDGSIPEIFATLWNGATLYLARAETIQSFPTLRELLKDEGITHFIMTPSALALLEPEGLPQLRTVYAGGEACSGEVVARWYASGRRFLNYYGPTEASVGTLRYKVTSRVEAGEIIPIGRPLHNTRVYVLDGELQPVPIGVVGEIYLGGVALARGYLNRPDLTAEKFIPDPFGDGTRLYRTGDLARYSPSGDLEFVGRRDHQVKVRGFRIELGEIEAALRGQEGIQEAIVVAREDDADDRRLVGYFVAEEGSEPQTGELREALRARLPEYMIPLAFVRLDELPVTASGKVDRKALPAPDGIRRVAGRGHIAPRDSIELQLVQIWEEILDVRPIGVRDDFFDLGGHSLQAVRLMARIERDLGKRPDMAAIFSTRTVEGLANVLREQGASPPDTAVVGLQTRGSETPLFFVHPSGGSVHWYAELARRLGSERPFYGLQARGLNGTGELHTRIEDMAEYYVEAMRTVQPEGPYLVGSWSFGVMVAFEMARQLHEQGESVERLFLLDQGPYLPYGEPEDDAEFLIQLFGGHVQLSVDELRKLDPEAQIAHVLEKAKEIDWVYPEVTLRDFRHFVRIMKTQQDAWRDYDPVRYPGRITLMRSDEQVGGKNPEADLGWGEFAAGGVEIHEVPGDHLAMVAEPNVKVLAERIQACLQ